MLFNFLKKNEIVKLKVLSILFEKDKLTIKELAHESGHTTTTVKRAIASLNEDLVSAVDNKCSIVNKNQMLFLYFEEGMGFNLLIKEIYKYYAENTVEYIIFVSIILQNETNILSLCMNNNISQSYCYSKIHDLNDYMKRYDVQIVVNNFVISMTGQESNIIFLTYMMIDLLDTLNIDYIEPFDAKAILATFPKEMCAEYNVSKNQLLVFDRIKRTFLTRQQQISDIQLIHDEVREILLVFKEENNLVLNRLNMHGNEDADLFYNLFIRCTVSSIDNLENRQRIARKCCENLENTMVKNAILLTQAYLNEFTEARIVPSDSRYYDIIYVVLLQTCYIDWLGIDFLAIFKNGIQNNILDHLEYGFNLVEQRVEDFVSKYSFVYPNWSVDTVASYERLLSKVFESLIFSYQQPTFNILVDSFTYFFDGISIKNQILAYYSKEMIRFVDSYEEADLVITDKFTPFQEFVPHFIFLDNHSNMTWGNLIMTIAIEVRKKFVLEINNKQIFFEE